MIDCQCDPPDRGQWCHSQSELFTGNLDTREDAIADGLEFYEGENFKIGRVVHALDAVAFPIDSLLENLEVAICDVNGFEGQIIELSRDRTEELAEMIKAFLREHATFNSHAVENIEELRFDDDEPE